MKQRIILFFAKPYRVPDEKTGEVSEGISLSYYLGDTLDIMQGTDGSVGLRPAKVSLPLSKLSQIKIAPAFYDGEFIMTVGSNNKPILQLIDVTYVCPLDIRPREEPKQQKG